MKKQGEWKEGKEKYPMALNGCDVVFSDAEVYIPSPKEVYEDTTTQGPRIIWSTELILYTHYIDQ